MPEAATLVLKVKEMDKLLTIRAVIDKKLTWKEAAWQLGLSKRMIGYLVARVRAKGNQGIIHGLRGKLSNHQLACGLIKRALDLVRRHYADFGPQFAKEKLETHGVHLSRETLRRAMAQAGLWQARTRRPKHRSWRPRRSCVGELVQADGSLHDWFEHRGPRCVLIAFIDDATSRILYARFSKAEDADTLFRSVWDYLKLWGRPVAYYVDKHSIYKVNRHNQVEPHLRDPEPMTQFSRAMAELGIEMIWAHSPQAKGRVERSFCTLQDRLIKEMRLRAVSTIEEGNRFLKEVFVADYNGRFAVLPQSPHNAHRPLLSCHHLDDILALKTQRILTRDFTLRFKDRFFQITSKQPVVVKPKDRVMVTVRLDGSIHLSLKGHTLRYKPLAKPYWKLHYQSLKELKRSSVSLPLSMPQMPSWEVSWRFQELKSRLEKAGPHWASKPLLQGKQSAISILQKR